RTAAAVDDPPPRLPLRRGRGAAGLLRRREQTVRLHAFWPMRGSVPAIRRRMLAWCRANTSTAITNASLTTAASARATASSGAKANDASAASDDRRVRAAVI